MTVITTPKTTLSRDEREARVRASYWLPTQQRWIDSDRRLKLMVKCRRFGGSWAEAFRVATKTAMQGNRYDAWIGSRDLLAARLMMNDVKKHSEVLGIVAQDFGEVVIENAEQDFRAFQVRMNGHDITSLSSSPDAFAGKQGRFTKDEAALHKELREWWRIAQPAIMRGGSISLISTQRGRANFFNELVEEIKHKGNPKKFELFEVNILQAVEEGLWIKIRDNLPAEDERRDWTEEEFLQGLRDECADQEAWDQEYMCKPSDDAAAMLTWEDIIACHVHDADRAALKSIPADAPRYVGMDVARKRHLSVIWKWALVAGVLLPEDIIVLEKKTFSEQEAILYPLIDHPTTKGVRIDATGLGMQLAERATERHPGKVKGLMLSAPEKLRLAVQMQRKFQDRGVRVPDDSKVTYDLYSVKKKVTPSDNVILTSEAGETDGHSDRFWAAALGIDAAELTGIPITASLC